MSYKNYYRYRKMMANGGPTDPPTKIDSVNVRNSSLEFEKAINNLGYEKSPEQNMLDEYLSYEDGKIIPNFYLGNINKKETPKGYTSYHLPPNTYKMGSAARRDRDRKIGEGYKYLEQISPTKYIASELISPEGYNTDLPTFELDSRIEPQGSVYYEEAEDAVMFPYYDPLAVTPWQDLTPEEQVERRNKYGDTGTPYDPAIPKPFIEKIPERSASSLEREVKRDELTQEMKDAGFTGYSAREVLKPGSDAAKAWGAFQNKESASDVDYKRYGKDKKPITDIPENGQIFVTSKDDPLYKEYDQRRKLYKESEKGWNLERDKLYKEATKRWDSFIEGAEDFLKLIKDEKADFNSEEDYQKLLKEQEDKIIETKRKKEEELKRIKEEDYLSEMKSKRLDFKTELNELENYGGGYVNEIIDYSTGTEINENKLDYLKDLNKSKYRPVLMYGPAESGYTVGWDKPKLRVTYRDPSEFPKTQLNEFIKSDDKQDWEKVKKLLNIPENDASDNYNPKIDGPFPSRTKKEPTYPKSAPEGYTLIKGYKAGDGKWYGNKHINAEGDEKAAGPTKEEGALMGVSGLSNFLPKKQYGGPISPISTETLPLINEVTKNLAKSEENKQFLISMANSPLFGERYKRMSGNPNLTDKEIESYRQDIINNLNTARPIHQRSEVLKQKGASGYYRPRTKEAVIALNPKDSTQAFLKKKEEQYNKWFPKQSHSINLSYGYDFNPSIDLHERSHSSTIGDLDLRKKDEPIARFAKGEDAHIGNYAEGTFLETPYQKLFPTLNTKQEKYLTEPTEQKARKDALAKHAQERGIYDPVNETFNETHYEKLMDDYYRVGGKKDREAVENIFNKDPYIYHQLDDTLKNYNKENVINMFNDFVQNENQEQELPMAAYGGPIAKYYHGGSPHDPPIEDMYSMSKKAKSKSKTSNELPEYNTATSLGMPSKWAMSQKILTEKDLPEYDKLSLKKQYIAPNESQRAINLATKKTAQQVADDAYRANKGTVTGELENIGTRLATVGSGIAKTGSDIFLRFPQTLMNFAGIDTKGTIADMWATNIEQNHNQNLFTGNLYPSHIQQGLQPAVDNTLHGLSFVTGGELGLGTKAVRAGMSPTAKLSMDASKGWGAFNTRAGGRALSPNNPIIGKESKFDKDGNVIKSNLFGDDWKKLLNKKNRGTTFNAERFLHQNEDFAKYVDESTINNFLAGVQESKIPHPVPKKLPGKSFKSEIDWAKWNKEIPNNKPLMKEYHAIEQSTKADGTWMKNVNGTEFKGTPEQFVQQQSKNFKKAFPNILKDYPTAPINILTHHSPNKFNAFDEAKKLSGVGKAKYGEGIYTVPKTYYDDFMTQDLKELASGKKPVYVGYGKNRYDLYANDIGVKQFPVRKPGGISTHPLPAYKTRPHTALVPYNNQLKSATGNNGMFDMSNSNIYKSLAPIIGAGALGAGYSEKEKPKKVLGGPIETPWFMPDVYANGGTVDGDPPLTWKNNKDYIQGIGDWGIASDVPITNRQSDDIKRKLRTGKYGYDPSTGTLNILNENDWGTISEEDAPYVNQTIAHANRTPEEQQAFEKAKQENEYKKFKSGKQRVKIDQFTEGFKGKKVGDVAHLTDDEYNNYLNQWDKNSYDQISKGMLWNTPGMVATAGLLPNVGVLPGVIPGVAAGTNEFYQGNPGRGSLYTGLSLLPGIPPAYRGIKKGVSTTTTPLKKPITKYDPSGGFRRDDLAIGESMGYVSPNYPQHYPTTKIGDMDVIVGGQKKIIPKTSGEIIINKKLKGSPDVKSTLDHEYDHLASPMFRSISGKSLVGDVAEKNYPTLNIIPTIPNKSVITQGLKDEVIAPFKNLYTGIKDGFKSLKLKPNAEDLKTSPFPGRDKKIAKQGFNEINVPQKLKPETTKQSRDKIKNWLDTDEYVKRRQKSTGETVEEIKKDVEIVKKELDESNVYYDEIKSGDFATSEREFLQYLQKTEEQQVRFNQTNKDIWDKLKIKPRKLTEKEVKNAFDDIKSYNFESDNVDLMNAYAKKLLKRKAKNKSVSFKTPPVEQIKKYPKLYDKYIKEYTKKLNQAWTVTGAVATGAAAGLPEKALGGAVGDLPVSQYKNKGSMNYNKRLPKKYAGGMIDENQMDTMNKYEFGFFGYGGYPYPAKKNDLLQKWYPGNERYSKEGHKRTLQDFRKHRRTIRDWKYDPLDREQYNDGSYETKDQFNKSKKNSLFWTNQEIKNQKESYKAYNKAAKDSEKEMEIYKGILGNEFYNYFPDKPRLLHSMKKHTNNKYTKHPAQMAYGGAPEYEAEGGEVIVGGTPKVYNGGNLKQISEDSFKIEGNSHENGGVAMSGGDYVYSDRIALDNNILSQLDL